MCKLKTCLIAKPPFTKPPFVKSRGMAPSRGRSPLADSDEADIQYASYYSLICVPRALSTLYFIRDLNAISSAISSSDTWNSKNNIELNPSGKILVTSSGVSPEIIVGEVVVKSPYESW